jgi:hypothetical protein
MDASTGARRLVEHIRSLPGFRLVEEMDGQYDHMGATITDSILQAGISYESVVAPRVRRLRAAYPAANTTSGFKRAYDAAGLATMLNWSGGEKLVRIEAVTEFFLSEGIETEADLAQWLGSPDNVLRFRQVRGIGEKTADYFKIMVGIPTSAIDRHLVNFLAEAGLPAVDYREAQAIVDGAADLLGWDRALFDHSIWKYMSTRSDAARPAPPASSLRPIPSRAAPPAPSQRPAQHDPDEYEEVEGDASIEEFRRNNAGYKRWVEEHPDGYVLNLGLTVSGDLDEFDYVLHRARCGAVLGAGRDWTGGMSKKVCSVFSASLNAWARQKLGAPGERCSICRP